MSIQQYESQNTSHSHYISLPDEFASESLHRELTETLTNYRQDFLGYLRKRINDRDEAEDVLHDFYLRAISKAGQVKNPQATLGWSYTVLKSVLNDHFRHKAAGKRVHQQFVDDFLTVRPAHEDVPHRADCQCLHRLLPSLRTEYVTVLSRVDLAGESHATVARALGITTGNLRVRLHRARQALKKSLRVSCDECRMNDCFSCETKKRGH